MRGHQYSAHISTPSPRTLDASAFPSTPSNFLPPARRIAPSGTSSSRLLALSALAQTGQSSFVEKNIDESNSKLEDPIQIELNLSHLRAENSRLMLKLKAGTDEMKRLQSQLETEKNIREDAEKRVRELQKQYANSIEEKQEVAKALKVLHADLKAKEIEVEDAKRSCHEAQQAAAAAAATATENDRLREIAVVGANRARSELDAVRAEAAELREGLAKARQDAERTAREMVELQAQLCVSASEKFVFESQDRGILRYGKMDGGSSAGA